MTTSLTTATGPAQMTDDIDAREEGPLPRRSGCGACAGAAGLRQALPAAGQYDVRRPDHRPEPLPALDPATPACWPSLAARAGGCRSDPFACTDRPGRVLVGTADGLAFGCLVTGEYPASDSAGAAPCSYLLEIGGGDGNLDAAGDAELAQDVGDMDAGGLFADVEGPGDLRVGQAVAEQGEYFASRGVRPTPAGSGPGSGVTAAWSRSMRAARASAPISAHSGSARRSRAVASAARSAALARRRLPRLASSAAAS